MYHVYIAVDEEERMRVYLTDNGIGCRDMAIQFAAHAADALRERDEEMERFERALGSFGFRSLHPRRVVIEDERGHRIDSIEVVW